MTGNTIKLTVMKPTHKVSQMILTNQDERQWFTRNLAWGLVSDMGISQPPVWVENLLKYPLMPYEPVSSSLKIQMDLMLEIQERLIYIGSRIVAPSDLPEDERRYALAREVLVALGGSKYGHAMGLPSFIVAHLTDLQDYFARVFLAPDLFILAYRIQGGLLQNFAQSFLIPPRIAMARWEETSCL